MASTGLDNRGLFDILSRSGEISSFEETTAHPCVSFPFSTPASSRLTAFPPRPVPDFQSCSDAWPSFNLPVHSAPVSVKVAAPKPSAHKLAGAKTVPAKARKSLKKAENKKRTWKKPKDKPKRPLSAYNLFFQAERKKIIAERTAADANNGGEAVRDVIDRLKSVPKRSHRKTHGKIGFAALARDIAARWKVVDDSNKGPFEKRAAVEKQRYGRELEVWKKLQELKKGDVPNDGKKSPNQSAAEMAETSKPPPTLPVAVPSSMAECQPTSLDQAFEIMSMSMDLEPITVKSMTADIVTSTSSNNSARSTNPTLSQHDFTGPGFDDLHSHLGRRSTDENSFETMFADNFCEEITIHSDGNGAIKPSGNTSVNGILTSLEKLDAEQDGDFRDFLSVFDEPWC